MKKWTLVLVLALTQFIMVLDSSVMNVSISAIVSDLNTSVTNLQAAITFYTLTMAAFMLTGGKLGDMYGRLKVFRIGAVVYGIGSLITAISSTIGILFVGWSVVEGIGAVMVIPATVALIAMNYKGKDRVVGYTALGAAGGIAVALGPLIGGYVTTNFSWRYVFVAETIVMAMVLLYSFTLNEKKVVSKIKLDIPSVVLSAGGMILLVFGILQSKTWGWVTPKAIPEISDREIAPLGISIVAYLIITGIFVLHQFYRRQLILESENRNPLLRVSMLGVKPLRSGLAVLTGQYFITASTFFIIPIYLQMVLGYDALETGKKIFPLSVGLVLFSAVGSKLINKYSPKQIVRSGQVLLVLGTVVLTGAINPELKGFMFGSALLIVGAGIGLIVSQIGNVTISAVDESKSSEVGGLQGTFQNFGAALGTAVIGSVMISSLTAGFVTNISDNPDISSSTISQVETQTVSGIQIATKEQVVNYSLEAGLSESEAQALGEDYISSQIKSLKSTMFFLAVMALLTLTFSRNIPDKKLI